MYLNELQQHIQRLANLEEATEPVVNCYLSVNAKYHKTLTGQVRMLKTTMAPEMRVPFWEALGRIEVFLGTGIRAGSQSVAVFARGGNRPFFLPLQFHGGLPDRVTVSHAPHIYPLVEMRDNCYRYVVLLSCEESASILEIDVGTITETIRIVRPELRQRVGREWTKEHYRNHSQARNCQFINEQVHLLDQVISSGEYRHLILAGDPRTVAQLRKALPKRLSNLVIAAIRASDKDKTSELVSATLAAFERHEEKESLSVVSLLGFEIGTKGAAVKGTQACIHALRNGQAGTLVLSQTHDLGTAKSCRSCNVFPIEEPISSCPKCGHDSLRAIDLKEEIVRLAEQNRCDIEIVKSSDAMSAFDGIGCLLRYLTPEQDDKIAA